MSNGEVRRWWVYEIKPHNDGDQFSHAKVARFENRRERTENNGMEYFKPKFGEVFEGPATEYLVMPVEDHERIVAGLQAQIKRFINAEIIRAEYQGFTYGQALDTIASQKRVIEKLKTYVQHRVDCICRAGVLQYSDSCDCGLEAIEKEGEK